jgi:hypothetical protein
MGVAIRGRTHPAATPQVEAPSRPCVGAHRPRSPRRRAADRDGEAGAAVPQPAAWRRRTAREGLPMAALVNF